MKDIVKLVSITIPWKLWRFNVRIAKMYNAAVFGKLTAKQRHAEGPDSDSVFSNQCVNSEAVFNCTSQVQLAVDRIVVNVLYGNIQPCHCCNIQ